MSQQEREHEEWCDLHEDAVPDYSYPLKCSCDVPHFRRSREVHPGGPVGSWWNRDERKGERRRMQSDGLQAYRIWCGGPERSGTDRRSGTREEPPASLEDEAVTLAMLVLQSDTYYTDMDARTAVDNILALTKRGHQ